MAARAQQIGAQAGDYWNGLLAQGAAYIEMALNPEVQRIVLLDGPAALGDLAIPDALRRGRAILWNQPTKAQLIHEQFRRGAVRHPVFHTISIVVAAAMAAASTATAQQSTEVAKRTASAPIRAGLPEGFADQFEHRYATANGVRLHYVIGGSEKGPLVVLLHGWPQTWYTWRQVMPPLARAGYRVAAIDYRGAGESEKPKDGYDKATMATDIRALVQQLGGAKVSLIGRDIGVMVAYAYASQWPGEVETLAMLDVPVPASTAWNDAKHKPDPELWHFGLFQQRDVAEMLLAGHEYDFIRDFYRHRAYQPVADGDIAVYARAYAAPGGLRAGFELYRAFPEDERRFADFMKKKLPMPVLALAGDKSNGMTELSMARELATNVHGGVAPETGHWLPDENPDFLTRQLLEFLPRPGPG